MTNTDAEYGNIEQLPEELIGIIGLFSLIKDILNLLLISKEWHKVIESDRHWNQKITDIYKIDLNAPEVECALTTLFEEYKAALDNHDDKNSAPSRSAKKTLQILSWFHKRNRKYHCRYVFKISTPFSHRTEYFTARIPVISAQILMNMLYNLIGAPQVKSCIDELEKSDSTNFYNIFQRGSILRFSDVCVFFSKYMPYNKQVKLMEHAIKSSSFPLLRVIIMYEKFSKHSQNKKSPIEEQLLKRFTARIDAVTIGELLTRESIDGLRSFNDKVSLYDHLHAVLEKLMSVALSSSSAPLTKIILLYGAFIHIGLKINDSVWSAQARIAQATIRHFKLYLDLYLESHVEKRRWRYRPSPELREIATMMFLFEQYSKATLLELINTIFEIKDLNYFNKKYILKTFFGRKSEKITNLGIEITKALHPYLDTANKHICDLRPSNPRDELDSNNFRRNIINTILFLRKYYDCKESLISAFHKQSDFFITKRPQDVRNALEVYALTNTGIEKWMGILQLTLEHSTKNNVLKITNMLLAMESYNAENKSLDTIDNEKITAIELKSSTSGITKWCQNEKFISFLMKAEQDIFSSSIDALLPYIKPLQTGRSLIIRYASEHKLDALFVANIVSNVDDHEHKQQLCTLITTNQYFENLFENCNNFSRLCKAVYKFNEINHNVLPKKNIANTINNFDLEKENLKDIFQENPGVAAQLALVCLSGNMSNATFVAKYKLIKTFISPKEIRRHRIYSEISQEINPHKANKNQFFSQGNNRPIVPSQPLTNSEGDPLTGSYKVTSML